MKLALGGLPLVLLCASAQYYPLHKVEAPSPHALTTVARFFVWTKSTLEHKDLVPAYGWGLWDKKYGLHAKIMSSEMAYILTDGTIKDKKTLEDDYTLDMAIMEYDTFWNKFVPFQSRSHFCCTKNDVAKGTCETDHGLLLPPEIREESFVARVPVGQEGLDPPGTDFPVPKSGIYFLMFVNCGKELPPGSLVGSVTARGAYGLLSGMDVPKLHLYALGTGVYTLMGLLWTAWCIRYRPQLILLHHLVGVVILLSLAEQALWYVTLSWTNVMTPGSDLFLTGAILSSTLRNISTCVLVLLACLGLCITRPYLETTTKIKIWFGAIALCVLDGARQVATHFHVSLDLSMVILMVCALPITLLYTVGFIWSFQSLNALLEELKARRQTAKFRQMNRYRLVLIAAALFFAVSTAIETYVLSMDIRMVWPYEWLFTDAVPNLLFFFILGVTAIIWRPNRSSKYYSYNLQLPDNELGDSTLDIDRIRADTHGKAFEVNFDSPSTTGVTDHRTAEIRAWGEIDLDLEEDDENAPRAEKQAGPFSEQR